MKPWKRKRNWRLSDVGKKLKLSSHETGKDCKCSRLKFFEIVNETKRAKLLWYFNRLKSHDEQNNYLGGLITILAVQNRRPRKREGTAKRNSSLRIEFVFITIVKMNLMYQLVQKHSVQCMVSPKIYLNTYKRAWKWLIMCHEIWEVNILQFTECIMKLLNP